MVIEDTETIADSSTKTLKQEIAECSANKFSHQLERDVGESTDAGDWTEEKQNIPRLEIMTVCDISK